MLADCISCLGHFSHAGAQTLHLAVPFSFMALCVVITVEIWGQEIFQTPRFTSHCELIIKNAENFLFFLQLNACGRSLLTRWCLPTDVI